MNRRSFIAAAAAALAGSKLPIEPKPCLERVVTLKTWKYSASIQVSDEVLQMLESPAAQEFIRSELLRDITGRIE